MIGSCVELNSSSAVKNYVIPSCHLAHCVLANDSLCFNSSGFCWPSSLAISCDTPRPPLLLLLLQQQLLRLLLHVHLYRSMTFVTMDTRCYRPLTMSILSFVVCPTLDAYIWSPTSTRLNTAMRVAVYKCRIYTRDNISPTAFLELKMELHFTATGCHLPYGITQCYLSTDTSEHTPP